MSDKDPISLEDLLKLANPQGLIGFVVGGENKDLPTINTAVADGLIKFLNVTRRLDTERTHETYEITQKGRDFLTSKGTVHNAGVGERAPISDKS